LLAIVPFLRASSALTVGMVVRELLASLETGKGLSRHSCLVRSFAWLVWCEHCCGGKTDSCGGRVNAYFSHFVCSFACVCSPRLSSPGRHLTKKCPWVTRSRDNSVIAHGNCFCHAMLHGCVGGADGAGVVADRWWWLLVADTLNLWGYLAVPLLLWRWGIIPQRVFRFRFGYSSADSCMRLLILRMDPFVMCGSRREIGGPLPSTWIRSLLGVRRRCRL
jgi:hypothetical protein